jgi:hypothetical protein
MSKTFDQGKDEVAGLCQYFAINQQSFLAPGVKEAHVRQSLIDPFFEALGWDVRNDSMTAPQYREVIPEDSLAVEGQQKAPDYTFRVGTLPKFYVEAKKCGVNISADPAPAYQLRRYGFSAKLALSILTDFDELGVYDCAARPNPGDKASHARIQYFGFTEYPDRWREIWDVFSREAVWSGSFDQYAASKRKRGTSEVDSEFLKDIEGWRDVLARNLALRNGDLSADDLNAAVQRIIDRIIFLRMAEDRGLEPDRQLLKLCEQPDIYARFLSGLCRKADEKYNSGLFHFQKESGVSDAPDALTPRLTVDDKALKPILQSLYFEHGSPYNFGVMPVEILGTVYERFLGKVIRLTAGHQAKVEEKPEVRKAGGVYYTPAYIVNYIVHNTIDKQIEGKSPADLAGNKSTPPFRVLDMACGSGSFLLGAYQALLDHCLIWHQANPSPKHAKAVYQNAKGETRLAIAERKRILITHIYGVDIDRQAVETTKLSLLLKALEGENDASLSQQMTLFHERALPNLSLNIKCGNSLIASDFSMVPEDLVHVHAFDWPTQFPDAMKAGGFDAIIGNPPYGAALSESDVDYFRTNYVLQQYQLDTYMAFIERSIGLVKHSGLVGMIIPNTWLLNVQMPKVREHLVTKTTIEDIVHFAEPVFKQATVDTEILIVRVEPPSESHSATISFVNRKGVWEKFKTAQSRWQKLAGGVINILERPGIAALADRLRTFPKLADFYKVTQGAKPFQVGKGKPKQTRAIVDAKPFISEKKVDGTFKPLLRGSLMRRYVIEWNNNYWISFGDWLAEPRYSASYDALEKVIIRQTGDSLIATLDTRQFIVRDNLYTIIPHKHEFNILVLLGLLNSKLLGWFYQNVINPEVGEALAQVKRTHLDALPIRVFDLTKTADKARHDNVVALVEKMLALTPKLRGATSESEKAALQNAVTTTDAEIDRLVYGLYGLTEEEIKIVEGEC